MTRYVAFLRGVSPVNARMPELTRCFEQAGFKAVKTVLSSGNIVFNSPMKEVAAIERAAEAAMAKYLDRSFYTVVRSVDALATIIESNPFSRFDLPEASKRVITFLRQPRQPADPLPLEKDGARILAVSGNEIFTAYVPSPRGPVFMTLIEKTFGSDVTTRTWDTVKKCANA